MIVAMTDDGVSLTIKITLDDVTPQVWRLVEVPSDMLLPELHDVIQDVMGWENRHLHMFFAGEQSFGDGQRYEMRFSLDEDDDGTGLCEDDFRVGDLLRQVGDSLGYEYDFGDSWGHRLIVDGFGQGATSAICLGGEGACPPEDCGGAHGYGEVRAAMVDVNHPEHLDIVGWLGDRDLDRFSVAEANERIDARRALTRLEFTVRDRAPMLAALFERAPLNYHVQLGKMLARVDFDNADIDPVVASVAMEKLMWFLTRIGEDGVKLTAAGYLPPKEVAAIRNELEWAREWMGNSNREVDQQPVHWLRHAVKQLGLVKVLKGRLLLTRDGKKLVDDPVGLWKRAASRMPTGAQDYELDAGLLLLASVAAGGDQSDRNPMMFESMQLIGWNVPPREAEFMQYLARPTLDFLVLIGAIPSSIGREGHGPEWGRVFATQCLLPDQSL